MPLVLYCAGGFLLLAGAMSGGHRLMRMWQLPVDSISMAMMFPIGVMIVGLVVVALGYGIDLLKTIKRANGKIVIQNAEMVDFFRRVSNSPKLNHDKH